MTPLSRLMPALPRRRFVALIGDEGGTLLYIQGRSVQRRCFIAFPQGENAVLWSEILAIDPHAPVYALLDVVEQQYREIDVPMVGPLDRGKVVRRKLSLSFPDDHLTGVLPTPTTKQGRQRRFLAAGLPATPEVKAWLEFLANADNPLDSVSLLPVESVPLIAALRPPGPPPTSGKAWQLLFTQQRSSGFRQVIAQNNRLIFTRITPNPPLGSGPDGVAETIEREFQSTVGYLRRLSFTDADRVEMIVIAEPAVCERLNAERLRVRSLSALSPAQVAERLGLREVADPDDGHSDALYAAYFTQRFSPVLSLMTPSLQRARLANRAPRLGAAAAIGALVIGAGFAAETALEWRQAAREHTALQTRLMAKRERVAALDAAQQDLPARPDLVEAVIDNAAKLDAVTPRLDALLDALAGALPETTQVLALNAAVVDEEMNFGEKLSNQLNRRRARRRGDGPDPKEIRIRLRIQLPGPFASRDGIAARFDAVTAGLRAALPGYDIEVARDPLAGGGQGFQGVAGTAVDPSAARLPRTVSSDLVIRGSGETS